MTTPEVWNEGVSPCAGWCQCQGAACVQPARPRCSVIHFPQDLENIAKMTLPDVPLDEQVFVTDPKERSWMFCVRTEDADAMAAWLRWYHSDNPNEPQLSLEL